MISTQSLSTTTLSCRTFYSKPTSRKPASISVRCNASFDRRDTLFLGGMTLLLPSLPAIADEVAAEAATTTTFFGTASPPTSYGGYGGNAKEDAKYYFDYPSSWKSIVPNKVEKGTQGIDCRVVNPKNKQQQAFVITFGRAGEDNKSFRLTDIETTFAGFAGADADMQDAISTATDKKTFDREIDGQKYLDIEIDSPDVQYLSSVTVKEGKVYAMFVKSPTRMFQNDEKMLRNIVGSFRTI